MMADHIYTSRYGTGHVTIGQHNVNTAMPMPRIPRRRSNSSASRKNRLSVTLRQDCTVLTYGPGQSSLAFSEMQIVLFSVVYIV